VNDIRAERFTTVRLEAVPLCVEHAGEMAEALSDPALHAFTGGAPDTPEELRARYRRLVVGSPDPAVRRLNWVLRLRDEACLTGTVQATVGLSAGEPVAEVAWVLGTRWQGRGIAAEAVCGLIIWLSQHGVRDFTAHIHPEHGASARVAAAAGLVPTDERHEGEIRWRRRIGDDATGFTGKRKP
jgi:RimJ/RimL family protein N-acetyltransferase